MLELNWRELPAGHALDRVVAERLGWTDIEEREVYLEYPEDAGFETRLYGIRPNPKTAMDNGYIPEYSTDANAALALLDGLRWIVDAADNDIDVCIGERGWNIESVRDLGTPGHAKTLAHAIVWAWLIWSDKQDA